MGKVSVGGPIGWGFVIVWTLIVLPFDVLIGYNLIRQLGTHRYVTTEGVVTRSEVRSSRDSDGDTTYRADIAFRYTVDGEVFESETYRYGGSIGTSGGSSARGAVARYPVGDEVVVYYDPSGPSRAVLETSISGFDLFIPLFLWPFNLVMVGLWFGLVWGGGARRSDDRVGGYRVAQDGLQTRLRLTSGGTLFTAALLSGLAAFLSIFPIAFLADGNPPIWVMKVVWAMVLGVGVLTLIWSWLGGLSGQRDLIIDHVRGVARLPLSAVLRANHLEVPLNALRSVDVRTSQSGTRVNDKAARELFVTYDDGSGEPRERAIAFRFEQPERLDEVALWLAETFHLELGSESKSDNPREGRPSRRRSDDDFDLTMET